MPSPLDTPELYDVVYLAGQALPGIAQVSAASRPYKWDAKQAKGSSGATTTYKSEDLAKIKVKLLLWLPEHIVARERPRVPLKSPHDVKQPSALDIQHPYLEELDIRSVVVEDLGQMEHSGKGLFTVTISLLEYRPPKKAGGTPKGSKSAGNSPSGFYQAPAQ